MPIYKQILTTAVFSLSLITTSAFAATKEYEASCNDFKFTDTPSGRALEQLINSNQKHKEAWLKSQQNNYFCRYLNMDMTASDEPNYFSFGTGKDCIAFLYAKVNDKECSWQQINECNAQNNLVNRADMICPIQE